MYFETCHEGDPSQGQVIIMANGEHTVHGGMRASTTGKPPGGETGLEHQLLLQALDLPFPMESSSASGKSCSLPADLTVLLGKSKNL